MKKALKIIIPLLLGFFLIYLSASNLSSEQIDNIFSSFQTANYSWVLFSVALGILSHVSRAMRWKYTIEAVGANYNFLNSFFSVMIAYLVNLAIPRAGEISRVASYSKAENTPFDKTLGTVIAERVVDFILLIGFMGTVFVIQFETLSSLVGLDDLDFKSLIILGIVGLIGAFVGWKIMMNSKNALIIKVKGFVFGLIDGLKSVFTMKNKGIFLMHTLFIWALYIAMFWVSTYALESTSHLGIEAVLTAFVAGGLSLLFTNGGLGAYPIFISTVLLTYGVSEAEGLALGWILWAAQTIMFIVVGGISFFLMFALNKDKMVALDGQ